jgi:deoxyribonuclease V
MPLTLQHVHAWTLPPKQACALQNHLRSFVVPYDDLPEVKTVAGVDVGYNTSTALSQAAVAVLNYPELTVLETAIAHFHNTFPYIPGLLSFREVPAILEALKQLNTLPDLILCDGQGLAHPRRFGLACHLGVLTNIPCIGVAKSHFIGTHDPLPEARGSWVPLYDTHAETSGEPETIGAVLRSQTQVNPLYISIGHRINLESAIAYTLACTPYYRLPETTRAADRLSRQPST